MVGFPPLVQAVGVKKDTTASLIAELRHGLNFWDGFGRPRQRRGSIPTVLTCFPYYTGWGQIRGWEGGGGRAPSLTGPLLANPCPMGKLLTRKQQWRRTRTRKHAWGDLPPEVLEAMLAVNHGGREKSFSWDYGYIGILGLKSSKVAEEANHREVCKGHPLHQHREQESADATGSDLTAGAKSASGTGDPVHIPRSMSCSSLSTKRMLFARSSSRVELSEGAAGREKATCRRVLGRRGVSFDTQVRSVMASLGIKTWMSTPSSVTLATCM